MFSEKIGSVQEKSSSLLKIKQNEKSTVIYKECLVSNTYILGVIGMNVATEKIQLAISENTSMTFFSWEIYLCVCKISSHCDQACV